MDGAAHEAGSQTEWYMGIGIGSTSRIGAGYKGGDRYNGYGHYGNRYFWNGHYGKDNGQEALGLITNLTWAGPGMRDGSLHLLRV